jgi:hypothetical protein
MKTLRCVASWVVNKLGRKKREEKEKGRCSMKKILVSLLVLALCAPAMADVTITGTDEGDGVLRITVAPTGGAEVRGVALLLGRSAGDAVIDDVNDCNTIGLNTNIDYFHTNGVGMVVGDTPDGEGHSLADPCEPGVIDPTGGISEFSVCSGYLDPAGGQAGYAVDSFFDITYEITVTSTVTIELDTLRGGVQGTNLGNVTIATPTVELSAGGCTVFPCCDDFNITKKIDGGPDPVVNIFDLDAFVTYVNGAKNGTTFVVGPLDEDYDARYNFDTSVAAINIFDLDALVTFVNDNKGTTWLVNCDNNPDL